MRVKALLFGSRRRTTSIWANRLVRSLAGQWGTTNEPTVIRSLGRFVPLSAPGPKDRPGLDAETRTDRLLEWTRSGHLTYGEAELLLALDESPLWRSGT
jgi:hypothetical protein